jgi:multidrug efflux pump subunit AcrA (membrane-fusion protein)
MSQEQAQRGEMLRQAGHAWQQAMAEVHALSARNLAPRELFAAFLQVVTRPLDSTAAAVWLQTTLGQLELTAERNLSGVPSLAEPQQATRHGRLLERVLTTGTSLLAAPGEEFADGAEAGNPTDRALVLSPLKTHQRAVGVVELFQSADKPAAALRGYLGFLVQACALLQDYLTIQSLKNLEERQAALGHIEQFARLAHRSLSRRQTAYTIANEGRRILECDRVSVAIFQNGRCRLEAISGQDVFDRRSNVVRRMQELATRVVKTGEPLWFPGDRADLAPQMEEAVNDFLDASQSRLVIVLPLARPQAEEEPKLKPLPPVGALVVEQFRETQLRPGCEGRLELVRQTSAQALTNALEYESFFLAPALRTLGKLWLLRNRPWTKLAAAGVVALGLALVLVPAQFELEGRGTLEPVGRHDVFAAVEGVVEQVLVEHGEVVQPGQFVVALRNTDVDVKLADLQGELLSTSAALRRVNTTLLAGKVAGAERERLHGERSQWIAKQASLKEQIALYEHKAAQLEVRTPVAGQVVTWDVRDMLIHRPVERGQMLLSVADVDGEWELEIRMPEERMGHIARAQAEAGPGRKLTVSFILATEPGVTYEGTLEEVHQRAEVRGEEGNVVLLRVALDKSHLHQLRRGATVLARVHCGRRALGYVWFHDLWEFVQSRVLFRL